MSQENTINQSPPQLRDYLQPVTLRFLKGKLDGKLYPIDIENEKNYADYVIACNGGPRLCQVCNEYFKSHSPAFYVCDSCRDRKAMKKFIESPEAPPGHLILSLISGEYGYCLEDFEELALDYAECKRDLSNDDIIWHCRLVNPSPNTVKSIDWADMTEDLQPREHDYVEPTLAVKAAIDALNQALNEQGPISWGPDWETRLPLSAEYLNKRK